MPAVALLALVKVAPLPAGRETRDHAYEKVCSITQLSTTEVAARVKGAPTTSESGPGTVKVGLQLAVEMVMGKGFELRLFESVATTEKR